MATPLDDAAFLVRSEHRTRVLKLLAERDGNEVHWLLGGRYALDLRRTDEGWRIGAITMTAVWDEGDETIFEKANP